MDLIPLLSQCDLEKLGVIHVGERVMLVNLVKAKQSTHMFCVVYRP